MLSFLKSSDTIVANAIILRRTVMVKKLETFRNVFKLERKLQFMNPQKKACICVPNF